MLGQRDANDAKGVGKDEPRQDREMSEQASDAGADEGGDNDVVLCAQCSRQLLMCLMQTATTESRGREDLVAGQDLVGWRVCGRWTSCWLAQWSDG